MSKRITYQKIEKPTEAKEPVVLSDMELEKAEGGKGSSATPQDKSTGGATGKRMHR